MRKVGRYLLSSLLLGFLVVAPVYLSVVLLLSLMGAFVDLVRPVTFLLPAWLPRQALMALLLVLTLCLTIGMSARTAVGRIVRARLESSFFERIPGYTLFRSLTQRVAGDSRETTWRPALVEIEEALVLAFVVEEFDAGRFTVFVPSVPTPLAGTVYVLQHERVHVLDVPFGRALEVIAYWGQGSKDLVAAMARGESERAD